jgi:citrate synthase
LSSTAIHKGLEDVVSGVSRICYIDGVKGTLLYRGYDVEELVQHSSYEEVSYLLLYGSLPKKVELDRYRQELFSRCAVPNQVLNIIGAFPAEKNAMDMLRTAVSALSLYDLAPNDPIKQSMSIVAKMPNLVSAIYRQKEGEWFVPLRKDLSLAATFLYSSYGTEPDPQDVKVLDALLILHADHELNASAFAGRVAASTLTDIYSAFVAAISALKGPLHGGANELAFQMLTEIGEAGRTEQYVLNLLSQKKKIMGFGHRVYRLQDPRAAVLRRYLEDLSRRKGNMMYLEIIDELERVMKKEKGLYSNLDLYTGSILYLLGYPPYMDPLFFALGRSAGWLAHILEQYQDNKIIRPRAEYVGEMYRPYAPIDKRF